MLAVMDIRLVDPVEDLETSFSISFEWVVDLILRSEFDLTIKIQSRINNNNHANLKFTMKIVWFYY